MSQHTPGKWYADDGPGSYWGIFDENGAPLAYLVEHTACRELPLPGADVAPGEWHVRWHESEANARLMATAPDLLETLRRIADESFVYSSDDDEETQLSLRIADARAALVKISR